MIANVVKLCFSKLGFTDKWQDFIGDPVPGFTATVYGKPQMGKYYHNSKINYYNMEINGFYDDDGNKINPSLVPKPGLCIICKNDDAAGAKDLAYAMKSEVKNLFLVLAYISEDKPGLAVMISENLVTEKGFDASKIVRELAKEINGGGGGQAFFATAGGKNVEGIEKALDKAIRFLK